METEVEREVSVMEDRKPVEIRDGKLCVETPLGTLVAYAGTDPAYPGIYIDLQRNGFGIDAPLALVEFTETEADMENEGNIISRIWGDVSEEDYSERIVHTGIADFFSAEDVDGNKQEYREIAPEGER